MRSRLNRKVEFGVLTTLSSTKMAVAYAQAAEAAGFDRLGLPDTAPKLYHGCYPAVTACLLGTERLSVGPYVTNPVTRHWSVHYGSARGCDELAPGRFFLGMGTGDGAVLSIGLKPAHLSDLEAYMGELRQYLSPEIRVHMAFSGQKGVEVAGRCASELMIGTGFDAGAVRALAKRARAARTAAGITTPLRIFAGTSVYLAETESEIQNLRRDVSGIASHGTRFAFDFSFDGKNVPEQYHAIIRKGLTRYDFAYHGKFGDTPNGHLFDDHPELKNYLIDRFALIGTPDQCAQRLYAMIEEAGLDGVWLMPAARTPGVEGAVASVRAVGQAFGLTTSR